MDAARGFLAHYYEQREQTWRNTFWLGRPIQKCPLDLWIYQELLWAHRPDLIIETGTYLGASAHFLATICDVMEHGEVITVDIHQRGTMVPHPRITYLVGSSVAPEIVGTIAARAANAERVMVVLDSDHRAPHVRDELDAYAPLVTPGSYLIVEDTIVNGRPVLPRFGPGPAEAVADFLLTHPEFVVDAGPEKFMMTFNPGGYLRRLDDTPRPADAISSSAL